MSVRFPLACLAAATLLAALSTRAMAQSPAPASNLEEAEVALEFRIISVPESLTERLGVDLGINLRTVGADGLERIGVDFNRAGATSELAQQISGLLSGSTETVQLNDSQVFRLMETIQTDQRTNIMQAPKLTVTNGQK